MEENQKILNFRYINQARVLTAAEFKDSKGKYLFYDEINKLTGYIESSILTRKMGSNGDQDKNALLMNTFSIVGERGSGKSSVLGTTKNILEDKGFFVFPVLDPSLFDDSLSILEHFVTSFYDYVYKNEKKADRNAVVDVYNKVRKVMKVLSTTRYNRETVALKSGDTEFLTYISDRVNFDILIKNLLDSFRTFYFLLNNSSSNRSLDFVVCIDDLDLVKNEYAYQMIEDISNFLSGNVTTIIAYRETQLYNIVLDRFTKDNEVLLEHLLVDVGELDNQTKKYIEKVVPLNNRIYLHTGNRILNEPILDIIKYSLDKNIDLSIESLINMKFYTKGMRLDTTCEDWINSYYFACTRLKIKPVDIMENTLFTYPQNLRGLIHLIHWLYTNLSIINDDHNLFVSDKKEQSFDLSRTCKELILNLDKANEYYIKINPHTFDTVKTDIIELWDNALGENKNYILYNELINLLIKENKVDLYNIELLDMRIVRPFNINMSDIYSLLEVYKKQNQGNQKELYFIYVMKLLYSIELLKQLLLEFQSEENYYFDLVNNKIVEEDILGQEKLNIVTYNSGLLPFFDMFAYEGIATLGDVKTVARVKYGSELPKGLSLSYGNYSVYETDYVDEKKIKRNNFVSTRNYNINAFTPIVKKNRVKDRMKNVGLDSTYYFYSMFDLDVFNSINYIRRTENDPFNQTLKKINNIFLLNLQTDREKKLSKLLCRSIFTTENLNEVKSYKFFTENQLLEFTTPLIKKIEDRHADSTKTSTINEIDEYKEFLEIKKEEHADYNNETMVKILRAFEAVPRVKREYYVSVIEAIRGLKIELTNKEEEKLDVTYDICTGRVDKYVPTDANKVTKRIIRKYLENLDGTDK